MIIAAYTDKQIVVDLLACSFKNNKSVNHTVIQDSRKTQRIKALMEYSFETCFRFGNVFLNAEKNACALVLYPDKKRNTPAAIWQDIQLIMKAIGLFNISYVIKRQKSVHDLHPAVPIFYLWYIGVAPHDSGKGLGSTLLRDVCDYAKKEQRPVFLETSTESNIPWYIKNGFELYLQLKVPYTLSCFKSKA
jgi:ribosomal protein S18 acetylase RimI-like enzyme